MDFDMQMYKYFTTKGVDALMDTDLKVLRKKIDRLRDDAESQAFAEQLQKAEEEATAIGKKYLKRVQEHPLVYFMGYEFSHCDVQGNGGWRFWFKPSNEPDFSI